MGITREEVRHVAFLARLSLTPEEEGLYCEQLTRIIEYMEKLKKLNIEGVEPTSHPIPVENPYREDRVCPSIPREEALLNAPQKEKGCFKVPRIIEGE